MSMGEYSEISWHMPGEFCEMQASGGFGILEEILRDENLADDKKEYSINKPL
jgi:hypothetical protein